jgi:hypothetical protein
MSDSGVLKTGDSSPDEGQISVEFRDRIRRSFPSGGGGNSDLVEYVEEDLKLWSLSRRDRSRFETVSGTQR